MTQIKYIGNHRPVGMVIDVDEDAAKEAIKSGEFVRLGDKPKVVKVKKIVEVRKKPDVKYRK